MVVLDAVGVVVVVGDEGRPLQAAGAGAAAEAVGMETLAHRLQHSVRDALPAAGAHRQGALGDQGHSSATAQPAIHTARAGSGLAPLKQSEEENIGGNHILKRGRLQNFNKRYRNLK